MCVHAHLSHTYKCVQLITKEDIHSLEFERESGVQEKLEMGRRGGNNVNTVLMYEIFNII